jgi:hypothetical protein
MNWQRNVLIVTLALTSLAGEITHSSPAAAASHYPLWVCGGRYGGWGWSRPAGLFGNLTLDTLVNPSVNGYGYWYPADDYVSLYSAYPNPYCLVSYMNGQGYSAQLSKVPH